MSGTLASVLISVALCIGVLVGIMFTLLVGYMAASKQRAADKVEDDRIVEEITAKIAEQVLQRSNEEKRP